MTKFLFVSVDALEIRETLVNFFRETFSMY
jgi:hypothetical protein